MTSPTSLLARAIQGDVRWGATSDWEPHALADAADDHGVAALLWRALEPVDTAAASALRTLLADRVRADATRDLFVQREMHGVLAALADAGVRALVIKGSALAYTVYGEAWLRPRTDTDVLVSSEDVAAAGRVLEGAGYTRSNALTSGTLVSHQAAFERIDQHEVHYVVDLHWKIVNPQMLADSLPFEDLWQGGQEAPALGPAARVPSPVASIALGCVHRLAHHQGHDRLIWLYDLRLLSAALGEPDWHTMEELACKRQIAGLCLDGLRQARDRVGGNLPEPVDRVLAEAAVSEPSRIYLDGPVHKRDVLVSDLARLRDWRAKARLLREHAFPPSAFIKERYHTRSRWLLPALYVHRLVTGAFRWVRP